MTKVDIFSGFLGAGKTTLIKKLIDEAYKGEKIVLIENEFGEIGIDGGFLKDAGIQVNEMNSGCICCSLVGDFGQALKKVMDDFSPDRILIEPSGVGKLSDIITAVNDLDIVNIQLNGFTAIVDAKKCKMYMKNFGEFFNNQVEHASSIILSHTSGLSQEELDEVVAMLKEHNPNATIVVTEWDKLNGKQILEAMESKDTLKEDLVKLSKEHSEAHSHEHNHHHDHEHDHDHEHHHHEHEHHHDHEHEHHHDHHHADEIFDSIGFETTHKYTKDKLNSILAELSDENKYGVILRAKGIVEGEDGNWIHFDYVPSEPDVRNGSASIIGRICVIGSNVNQDNIKKLFEL